MVAAMTAGLMGPTTPQKRFMVETTAGTVNGSQGQFVRQAMVDELEG